MSRRAWLGLSRRLVGGLRAIYPRAVALVKFRLDFIHGVIPRRATARETLEVYRSGSLRRFVLVCARGLILGLVLELIQFPIF